MKKIVLGITVLLLTGCIVTGCTETVSTDENGNKKTEFSITETATVNDTNIKINSVKKILKECSWEYEGKCESYTEPENDYFLLIDLTIENNGTEDLSISSLMSFELKTPDGEQAEQTYFLDSITSQLDGTIMPGDLLKGQIAYDVKSADKYYFYFVDSLLDSPIKFVINSSDISE